MTRYKETKAVVFDFAESRAGTHARELLGRRLLGLQAVADDGRDRAWVRARRRTRSIGRIPMCLATPVGSH
ncbi:MAG: hypothetical protein H7Y19_14465 [Luteimonas sp.]|nr:hypothetical protein [Luteimonas sp.]